MGYSLDPISDHCYPGTTILINKFGIQDEEKLNEIEGVISSVRSTEWLTTPRMDTFDFEHYKAIHSFLFSDLYDWAGQVRTVNISKKGTRFCKADQIGHQAELIFKRLKSMNYFRDFPYDEFLEEIADFYCVTNDLHPFREGNGRTQRIFLMQLIHTAGYELNFVDIDTDLLMIATIQASHGVSDLLKDMLREHIRKQ